MLARPDDIPPPHPLPLPLPSLPCPMLPLQLRFVCMANGCRAVNIKPMNPLAFNKGTAFAQCAGCNKWHLIK